MLNLNKHTKAQPKPKPTIIFDNCHTQHSTEQF